MACSIKFVRLDDFIADIDEIDLMANGYSLADNGYMPVSAPDGAAAVHEVITLKLQGTSKDDLASMTQEIDEKIKQVGWWLNNPGVERYQVWLRVQLDNESLPRQAQILDIIPPDKVRVFTPEEWRDNYIGNYSITIERTPYWEDPYPYPTATAKTGVAPIGGIAILSDTVNGDVPARLGKVTIVNSTPSVKMVTVWMGVKTSRFGNTANFVSVWQLSLGSYDNSDTAFTSDATAYAGSKLVTDFTAGATLLQRVAISVNEVAASNPADQRGTYTVLLRAKMSDTSVARVRMGYGFAPMSTTGNSPVYRSRQVVSGTSWAMYELGDMSIPASIISAADALNGSAVLIDAERISGSGNLEIDCLVLIPREASLKINTTYVGHNGDTRTDIFQKADGRLSAYSIGFGIPQAFYSTQPTDWGLPANRDKPIVIMCQNTAAPGSYTMSLTCNFIPRWRTLRGSDT